MGERKGVNKYYPPDFDYKKHGSLDKYHNSHPLRERAKKLGEGILIIRFEMPYNIWCNGCNKHIGMGVRYNAEKKKMGNYYTTPIYKFNMKCHLCPQYFEIQTDPANCEYVILSGARRKEERWDAKANEQIEMTDHMDKKKLATDPMFKLEHNVKDKKKLSSALPTLEEIQDIQEEKRDDYLLNKALRKKFRDTKKSLEAQARSDNALLHKSSLNIKLLPENELDKTLAKLLKYDTVASFDEKQEEVRKEIASRPVLESSSYAKEVKTVAAKLPISLGSALKKTLAQPSLWDDLGNNKGNHSGRNTNKDSLKSLGIKITRKRSNSDGKPISSPKEQKQFPKMTEHENAASKPITVEKTAHTEQINSNNVNKNFVLPNIFIANNILKGSLVASYSESSSENSD